MFSSLKKAANMAVGMATGKEIFSEEGKVKLQQVSAMIQSEIERLGSENPASAEIAAEMAEALNILRKIKALMDKLVTLNTWQLIALGSLETDKIDSNKPIEDLSLEELVRDLLLNRDIYWDIKNKHLHTSLAGLFAALKDLKDVDFGEAGVGVLYTIGGIEKIHAVGIILSALLPFYQQAIPFTGLSEHAYHPAVDTKRFPSFRQELFNEQDNFLKQLETEQNSETQRNLCEQYRVKYQSKVTEFLDWIMKLPGGDVFLDRDNRTFKEVSVRSFNPQAGIFRGLLQAESSLNKELQGKYPHLYLEGDKTFLLDTTYQHLIKNLTSHDQLLARRQALFTMVENDIITPFRGYITENENSSGLAQEKATLLKQFLDFIYDANQETFFNSDKTWRTAETVVKSQLYMCFELAQKLLAQLITVLKIHDAMCKRAGKGVGRTGLLLAHAIEKTVEHLAVQYDFRLDDNFLRSVSDYEKDVGISQSQTSSGAVSASSSSSGSNAAGKEEEKGVITASAPVSYSPSPGRR